jgi:hypothetical protein
LLYVSSTCCAVELSLVRSYRGCAKEMSGLRQRRADLRLRHRKGRVNGGAYFS